MRNGIGATSLARRLRGDGLQDTVFRPRIWSQDEAAIVRMERVAYLAADSKTRTPLRIQEVWMFVNIEGQGSEAKLVASNGPGGGERHGERAKCGEFGSRKER
jgi:hypothetical protein